MKSLNGGNFGASEGNTSLRCYFMKDGHIAAVEFLKATDDQARLDEARKLFEKTGRPRGADGFEVWDGAQFIARFPEQQT